MEQRYVGTISDVTSNDSNGNKISLLLCNVGYSQHNCDSLNVHTFMHLNFRALFTFVNEFGY